MSQHPSIHADMDVLRAARSGVPPKTVEERRQQWGDYTRKLSKPAPQTLVIEDEA